MFSAHCSQHGTEVLLSERRIIAIEMDADTVLVRFRCWCGTEGSFLDPRLPAASAADLAAPADDVLGGRQLA